jgi:RNA polymerase sigma-70 factor (ECF subfamily)
VSRRASGDQRSASFERIFAEFHGAVVRYAARRVAPELVQDVVSETFLVAWRRFADLDGPPLPWLLGIARRVAANQRRSGARRDALVQRLGRQSPAAAGEVELRDSQLAAALATLGERDREALLLVVWDGLEHRDAAQVLGCSTGALTTRLHRARRRLARALDDGSSSRIAIVRSARSPS